MPRLLRWQGVQDLLRGKQRRGLRRLSGSIDEARDKGMQLELALSLVELADALGDGHADAERYRSEAADIFSAVGSGQQGERRAA